jgi:hypothetical protein
MKISMRPCAHVKHNSLKITRNIFWFDATEWNEIRILMLHTDINLCLNAYTRMGIYDTIYHVYTNTFGVLNSDRLCGLVVRVLGYRSGG